MRRTTSMMVDGTLFIVSGSVKWGARAFFHSYPGRSVLGGVNWMIDVSENLLFPSSSFSNHIVILNDNLNNIEAIQIQEENKKLLMIDMAVQTEESIPYSTNESEVKYLQNQDLMDEMNGTREHLTNQSNKNQSETNNNSLHQSSRKTSAQNGSKCTPTRNPVNNENYTNDISPSRSSCSRKGSSPASFYGVGRTPTSRYIKNRRRFSGSEHNKSSTFVGSTPCTPTKKNSDIQPRQVAKVRPLAARNSNISPASDRNGKSNLLLGNERKNNPSKPKNTTLNNNVVPAKRPLASRSKSDIIRKNIEAASNKPAPYISNGSRDNKCRLYKKSGKPEPQPSLPKRAKMEASKISSNTNKALGNVRSAGIGKVQKPTCNTFMDRSLSLVIEEPTYEDIDVMLPLNDDIMLSTEEHPSTFYQLVWNLGHEIGDDDYERFLGEAS